MTNDETLKRLARLARNPRLIWPAIIRRLPAKGMSPEATEVDQGPTAVHVTPEMLSYAGPDPHMTADELARLKALKGSYAGERIFVMGNGPSLNRMDLSLLGGEHVFALNRVSLLYDRIDWRPNFYTAFDLRVVPDNLDEFNKLDIPHKFFATKHKGAIEERDNHYWYHDRSSKGSLEDRFVGDPAVTGFGGGGSVACVAIQIAAYLGFDPIILIGCDASYVIPETVIQAGPDKFGDGTRLNLKSTRDDDPNHFDPRYFGTGKKWHTPNTSLMHKGFEECYRQLARLGVNLVNATDGGALESVPRVSYPRLFAPLQQKETMGVLVGVDLTHEMAQKPTGMRNSLISTLSNTQLMNSPVYFVLLLHEHQDISPFEHLLVGTRFKDVRLGDPASQDIINELDAILLPFNDGRTQLKLHEKTKRISYINDLIPLNQPGFSDTMRRLIKTTAHEAAAILCLTDTTKAAISAKLEVPLESIFVCPPAVGDDATVVPVSSSHELITEEQITEARERVGVKFNYLVYPAAFRPHKNHDRLFEAMRYVYTNLQLVLTTGETHDPSATARMLDTIRSRNMAHRILVAGHLERDVYLALLMGAEAVIFPSLEEGFGIPVAEAQALRVPVVSSRCGALEEVARGSLEIDPFDHRDIAENITALISDDDLKAAVVEAGWTNSRRYSKEWGAHGLITAINFVIE